MNKRIYFLLILTTAAWGSLYVASKFVLGYIPTFTILFVRYLIASVCMFFVLRRQSASPAAKPPVKLKRADYKYVALLGIGGYVLSVTFQQTGTKLAGASTASLINSMNPVTIALLSSLILHENITKKKIISVVCAVAGAFFIIGGAQMGSAAGILFSFGSVLVWSVVSVFVRRVTQTYDPLRITAYSIYLATLVLLPFMIHDLITTSVLADFSLRFLLPIFYMGSVCTAGAHTLWNYCLSHAEASTCALFYPIQPLTSVALGILLLGEQITPSFLVGAALVISGVLYCSLGKELSAKTE